MDHRFDKLEEKLDQIRKDLHKVTTEYEGRLTKVDTVQKGFITVFSAILTACIATLAKLIFK